MRADVAEMLPGRILVVDDEDSIHAAIRLRLGNEYEIFSCYSGKEALDEVAKRTFDLCLADISMPRMDGIAFVNEARRVDPGLGYVIVSAYDTDENLRRTIPLQVLEFVPKPLPDRAGFDTKIPQWISAVRARRAEVTLARRAAHLASDLDVARIEREVEFVASEGARDVMLQIAGLLTTIHAHFLAAVTLIQARDKPDVSHAHLLRNLTEGKKAAEAAMAASGGFFDSAYGSRNISPGLIIDGLRSASGIVARVRGIEESNKLIDVRPFEFPYPVRGLSGIELLLALVPVLNLAVALADSKSTVGVDCETYKRLETILGDARFSQYRWINRRSALTSRPGVAVVISSSALPLEASHVDAWLNGTHEPLANLTSRGLIPGVQKCHGMLGFAVAPQSSRFGAVMAFPT